MSLLFKVANINKWIYYMSQNVKFRFLITKSGYFFTTRTDQILNYRASLQILSIYKLIESV
jgi:hypothetical protein